MTYLTGLRVGFVVGSSDGFDGLPDGSRVLGLEVVGLTVGTAVVGMGVGA